MDRFEPMFTCACSLESLSPRIVNIGSNGPNCQPRSFPSCSTHRNASALPTAPMHLETLSQSCQPRFVTDSEVGDCAIERLTAMLARRTARVKSFVSLVAGILFSKFIFVFCSLEQKSFLAGVGVAGVKNGVKNVEESCQSRSHIFTEWAHFNILILEQTTESLQLTLLYDLLELCRI